MRFSTIIAVILILSGVGLTYEIAAGRVLAPFFGTSLVTWTTVIAVVLAGFSLGSALGGLIAEKPRPAARVHVRNALVASALLMSLSPFFLGLLTYFGLRGTAGMIISVIVVFFPASVLITLPSPYLAKLAIEARPGREGSSLGLVLAAGSVGAIFGAVLAGFVALPLIGATATFAACGAVTLLCLPFLLSGPTPQSERMEPADTGLGSDTVISIGALGLVGIVGLVGSPVCQFESGQSCLHVVVRDGAIRLYADGVTQGAEPVAGDADNVLALPYTQWLWRRLDADVAADGHVLFVGGGGFSLPTQFLRSRADAHATVVEIDPMVTDVVVQSLPRASSMIRQDGYAAHGADTREAGRLGIVHDDGRVYVNETSQRFDAVVMDAFSSGSVPAHLATMETYERLQEVVTGPVYVNLIDRPDGTLARGVNAILSDLYPYVIAVRGPVGVTGRTNVLLAASPMPFSDLDVLPEGYQRTTIPSGRAFTDDRGWVGHR